VSKIRLGVLHVIERNRARAFGEFSALESCVSIEFNISEIGKEIERKEKSVQQKAAGSNSVSVYTARNGAGANSF